jgi:TM2 domain-containing membrane protein YozV
VIFQKKRAVAFGMCFFVPGGGHLYAMRPVTGLLIGLAILAGLFLAVFLFPARIGLTMIVFGFLADIVGSQLSFTRMKQGKLPGMGRQALVGLGWLLVAMIASWSALVLMGPPSSYPEEAELWLPFFYW